MTKKVKRTSIPEKGAPANKIQEQIDVLREKDVRWKEGRTWSLVYQASEEHDQFLSTVADQFFSANYLNPLAFKSLQEMEKEVVDMSIDMLNGGDNEVGTMSSGGTESILLAIYTYREWARKNRSQIQAPEIVVPETVHPAHEKAAHLFGLKVRKAKVSEDKKAIVSELEKQINKNTILIAASAPSYPHGVLDPIPEIGKLAEKYNLPFHVDSCIGGFMLPWIERLGNPLPKWDFRVPAVTSISADIHKFGFGAKGASVILYRSMEFLKFQFFITTDWSGGIYASPTLLGSRAGGPIAAAWAGMQFMGASGYLSIAEKLLAGRKKLQRLFSEIPEIKVIGQPCMNILAYTTHQNKPDIFAIADHLENKGWMLDRQQAPACIHLTVMPTNVAFIDQYVEDVQAAIVFAKANPKASGEGNAAIYGMSARIPFRGLVKNNVLRIYETMYGRNGSSKEEATGKSQTIAPAPRWMGWMSRFLASWKKISSGK